MKKSAVDESDSEADKDQDDTAKVENNHSGDPSTTISWTRGLWILSCVF